MDRTRQIGYRPTWAEIYLDNIAYNFRQVKKFLSAGTKTMATVKADAYGHGLVPVAKKLVKSGADYLGVASIDEGISLRRGKIQLPILVLGMVMEEDIAPLFEYNLIPTVCTEEFARALDKKAARLGVFMPVHVEVDTGMSRIGVTHSDAFSLIVKIRKLRNLRIEGLFTHFASADMDRKFTLYQIALFNQLLSKLKNHHIHIPFLHAANSMGLIGYKMSHFNMVRPGLVLYGLYPKEGLSLKLKPALSLKSKIIYFKRLPKGQGVSYGHTYITKKETTVVTLPIGYGDGYPRNLSNLAPLLIRGRRFKISGRVCMDQIMVDVGDLRVKIGDEVVLIGSQGKSRVTAGELAKLSGTIPYEIVCGLGNRVPRVYF